MSMITTACPVCQQLYSVGVVGSGVVGGHTCPVKTALVHAGEVLHTIAADISDYETPEQGVEWRVKFAHETSLAIEALDIGRLQTAITDARVNRAVDALLADSGLPRFGGYRANIERRVRLAFAAAGALPRTDALNTNEETNHGA
jgi:hypothetical protein